MKKFVAIFLIFILIFSITLPSYANLISGLDQVNPTDKIGIETIKSPSDTGIGDASSDAGSPNSILQIVLDALKSLSMLFNKWLIDFLEKIFPTIEGSIWAKQGTFQISYFSGSNGSSLAGAFKSTIGSVYNGLRYLVAAVYIIVLVYFGIRMILSSIGKQKAHYKELLKYWFTGLLLLFSFHWVMAFIIWLSDTITAAFASLGTSALTGYSEQAPVTQFIIQNINESFFLGGITSAGWGAALAPIIAILGIIALIVLLVFATVIAFTYLKRLFTIGLLIVLFPLVVLFYVLDKIGDRKSQSLSEWFRDFVVNVALQPIHAFLLALIACMFGGGSKIFETPLVGTILALLALALIPIGEHQLKDIFQISSKMGPGRDGIAGTLAQATFATRTLENIANSITNAKERNMAFKSAEGYTKQLKDAARNDAYKKAKKKGLSDVEARKRANEAANSLNLQKNKKYRETMKQLIGDTDLERAKKNRRSEFTWKAGLGTIGAGTALATSRSLGELGGNMAKSVAAGAITGKAISGIVAKNRQIKNFETLELDEVENEILGVRKGKISSNINLKNLNDAEKEKISTVLGINKDLIDNSPESRQFLEDRIRVRREAAKKYRIPYNSAGIDLLEEDGEAVRNIKSGLSPDGTKKFNRHDFTVAVGKDATYIKDPNDNNKIYQIKGWGNAKASDRLLWQEAGVDDETFEKKIVVDAATDIADEMVKRDAFKKDSSEYKKFLGSEIKENFKYYKAHNKTFNTIESISHTVIQKAKPVEYKTVEERFNTVEDIDREMQKDDYDKLTRSMSIDFTSPKAVNTRENVLNMVRNFDKVGFSPVRKACVENGVSYSEVENGTVSDDKLQNIINSVSNESEFQNYYSAEKIKVANKIDVESRQNDIITKIANDSLTTQTIKNYAVSEATGGATTTLTSNNVQTFINNSTPEVKTKFCESFNQLQNYESDVTPYSRTVMSVAQKGEITKKVEIVSGPSPEDLTKMYGTNNIRPGENIIKHGVVMVEPIRDNGTAKTIFIPNGEPEKQIVMNTKIDTGGCASVLAGSCSLDEKGNIEVLCSEEELDYSLDDTEVNDTDYDVSEVFADFNLSEINSIAPASKGSKEFTVIKNHDICAIIDSSTKEVLFIKDGLFTSTDKLTQFTVKDVDGNGELKIVSTPFASIDVLNKSRLMSYKKRNTDSEKLINRLLDVK